MHPIVRLLRYQVTLVTFALNLHGRYLRTPKFEPSMVVSHTSIGEGTTKTMGKLPSWKFGDLRVGNLQILWGMLERVVGAVGGMLATYRSYGADCKGFGAVCWQATGLMGQVGKGLGCMLATYRRARGSGECEAQVTQEVPSVLSNESLSGLSQSPSGRIEKNAPASPPLPVRLLKEGSVRDESVSPEQPGCRFSKAATRNYNKRAKKREAKADGVALAVERGFSQFVP